LLYEASRFVAKVKVAGTAFMLDWLLWPAELLLAIGAAVASLFTSKDTINFVLIQMMVATLVLAAIVLLIVLLERLVRYWWLRKRPVG
jgi:hypothetical protein